MMRETKGMSDMEKAWAVKAAAHKQAQKLSGEGNAVSGDFPRPGQYGMFLDYGYTVNLPTRFLVFSADPLEENITQVTSPYISRWKVHRIFCKIKASTGGNQQPATSYNSDHHIVPIGVGINNVSPTLSSPDSVAPSDTVHEAETGATFQQGHGETGNPISNLSPLIIYYIMWVSV
jgi:hypothetical protein